MTVVCLSAAAAAAATATPVADPAIEVPVSEVVSTAKEKVDEQSWDRFAAAGAKSGDLRLRIVFSRAVEERSGGTYLHETIPLDALVEQARGSTDPLVLAMLIDRCGTDPAKEPRCDALDLARRWTVADAQNQLAWVTLAAELNRRGDRDAARATFVRAAQTSMWHEHDDDVARVLARALPRTLAPRDRLLGLSAVLGTAAARTMSMAPDHFMRAACKEIATREACTRILETIFRDGTSLLRAGMSIRLAEAAGFSAEAVHARKLRYEATHWALGQIMVPPEGAALDDPAIVATALGQAEQRIELGEIQWGRRLLQQSRVSEADAAARYVAALPSRQPQ